MNEAYIRIGDLELVLAAALLAVNVGLSIALRLGLERSLVIAAVRMVVQLLAVGLVLEWLFALRTAAPVLLVAMAMTVIAAFAAVGRTTRRFTSLLWDSLIVLATASGLIAGLALAGIIRVEPWFEPQYLIPILGMVLGNALNGVTLGLESFTRGLEQRRSAVEALLCLGATRWEAAHAEVRNALRVGMIPTINTMMITGVVALPGMMTGQILGGVAPADAVRYQIVIMFMIASGTALALLGIVLLAFRVLFDERHRLRLDRLQGGGRPRARS